MTIPALPNQSDLMLPLQWQGQTQKTTMQAAGYQLSGTIGLRPYQRTTTFTWLVDPTTANALLGEFESGNFNGVYTYECAIRGTIKIRLTGNYSVQEEHSKPTQISVEAMTV